MKNIKKSFSMFEGGKKKVEEEKSSISDRIKEFFPKGDESTNPPPEYSHDDLNQEDIYSLTKKCASAFMPKNVDPVLRDLLEAGTAYLIFDLVKKYKT